MRKTKTFEPIWYDLDTRSTHHASFWRPHLMTPNEYYLTMHAGTSGAFPDEVAIVITKAPEGVLKKPQAFGWKKVWTNIGSGGRHKVMFIQPKPEPGYICFGSYIHNNYDNPGDPAIYGTNTWHKYRCVHEKWVNITNNTKDQSQWFWNDKNSGAKDDGSIFKINVNGLPYHYYRTDGPVGYPSSYPGPYYELIPFVSDCDVKKIEINSDKLTQDLLIGATLTQDFDFTNHAYQSLEFTLLEKQRCITTSTTFTHTNGYQLSLGIKYSFEHTIGNDATPTKTLFGQTISLSAKIAPKFQTQNTENTTTCTTKSDEKFICPPRSICRRKDYVLTPVTKTIPLKITLMCGINRNIKEVMHGTFESTGALKYLVQNQITKLNG